MIYIDGKKIIGVSQGDTPFIKIYKGFDLVWRRTPEDITDFIIPRGNEAAGDVILWDREKQRKIVVGADKIKKFKSTCTPIGIVAIPSSHDVYGTGECGVMALRFGSASNPDEGSASVGTMNFGFFGTKISSKDYNGVNVYTDKATQDSVTTISTSSNICGVAVEGETVSSVKALEDEKCSYSQKWITSSGYFCPTPYLNDGNRNSNYYLLSSGTSKNALADFDGKGNNENILSKVTTSNWKTLSSLTSVTNGKPACACWRYSTEGTEQGEWYLPSLGELGYIDARVETIAKTLDIIKEVFNIDIINTVQTDYYFHTSTEDSVTLYRTFLVDLKKGLIYKDDGRYTENKDKAYAVIPFTRMYIEDLSSDDNNDVIDCPVGQLVYEIDTSYDKKFTLPFQYYNNVNDGDIIDWGDGTIETTGLKTPSYASPTHTYQNEGIYIVRVTLQSPSLDLTWRSTSYTSNCLTKIHSFGYANIRDFKTEGRFVPNLCKIGVGAKFPTATYTNSTQIQELGKATVDSVNNGEYYPLDVTGFFQHIYTLKYLYNMYFTDLIGDPFEGCTTDSISNYNTSGSILSGGYITTIHKICIPECYNKAYISLFPSTTPVYHLKELTLNTSIYNLNSTLGNSTTLCELCITNLGIYKGSNALDFSKLTNWGNTTPNVTSAKVKINNVPNARDSVIKSLAVNSKDLTLEGRNLTISLSAFTKGLLDENEIAQITSKGYTIS